MTKLSKQPAVENENIKTLELYRPRIDVDSLLQVYEYLKGARSSVEQEWTELRNEIFPLDSTESVGSPTVPGGGYPGMGVRTRRKNYSGVILSIINRIVSQLYALIANPGNLWLGLELNGPTLLRNDKLGYFQTIDLSGNVATQRYLQDVSRLCLKEFSHSESNFYQSFFQVVFDVFTYGCATRKVYSEPWRSRVIFDSVNMKDIFIDTDQNGEVSRLFRYMKLNLLQSWKKWGEGLSDTLKRSISSSSSKGGGSRLLSENVELVEVTEENPYTDLPPAKKYVTITLEKSTRTVVGVEFSDTFPYVVSRMNSHGDHLYGRTYVSDSLTTIKTINKLSRLILENVTLAVQPPLMVKNASSLNPADLYPRAVLPLLDATGRPSIAPLGISGDSAVIQATMQYMQTLVMELEQSLIIRDVTQPEQVEQTATAINIRNLQNQYRTIPFIVKFEQTELQKSITRTIRLLAEMNALPFFPYEEVSKDLDGVLPEIEGYSPAQVLSFLLPDPLGQTKVSFRGQLTRTQRIQDALNSELVVSKAAQLNQLVNQNVKYIFNGRRLIQGEIESYDLPLSYLNTKEEQRQMMEADQERERAEMEGRRAEAQKAQAEAERTEMETQIQSRQAGYRRRR